MKNFIDKIKILFFCIILHLMRNNAQQRVVKLKTIIPLNFQSSNLPILQSYKKIAFAIFLLSSVVIVPAFAYSSLDEALNAGATEYTFTQNETANGSVYTLTNGIIINGNNLCLSGDNEHKFCIENAYTNNSLTLNDLTITKLKNEFDYLISSRGSHSNLTIDSVVFSENNDIYNLLDEVLVGRKVKILSSAFEHNSVSCIMEENWYYNDNHFDTELLIDSSIFSNNTVTSSMLGYIVGEVRDSKFLENTARYSLILISDNGSGKITISSSEFDENKIGNSIINGPNLELNDTEFTNNETNNILSFVNGKIKDSNFIGNTVRDSVIFSSGSYGLKVREHYSIESSVFEGNSAKSLINSNSSNDYTYFVRYYDNSSHEWRSKKDNGIISEDTILDYSIWIDEDGKYHYLDGEYSIDELDKLEKLFETTNLTLENSSVTDNIFSDGLIFHEGGDLIIDIKGDVVFLNNTNSTGQKHKLINNNGKIVLNNANLTIDGGISSLNGTIEIKGISKLKLLDDATVESNNFTITYGSTLDLDLMHNGINNINLGNFTVDGNNSTNLEIDADLASQEIDNFAITGIANGTVNLTELNILDYDGKEEGSLTLFSGGNLEGLYVDLNNMSIYGQDIPSKMDFEIYKNTQDNSIQLKYFLMNLPMAVQSTKLDRTYIFDTDEIYETKNELPSDWANPNDFSPLGVLSNGDLTVNGSSEDVTYSMVLTGTGTSVESGTAGSAYGVVIENGSELTFKDINIEESMYGGASSSEDSSHEHIGGDAYGFKVDSGTLSIINSTANVKVAAGSTSVNGTNGSAYGIYAEDVNSKVEIKDSSVTISASIAEGGQGEGGQTYGIYSNGDVEIENSYFDIADGILTKNQANTLNAEGSNFVIDIFIDEDGNLTSDYFKITGEDALNGDITLQLNQNLAENIVVSGSSLKSVTVFRKDDALDSDPVPVLGSLNLYEDYFFEVGNRIYQFYTNSSTSALFYNSLNLKQHLNRSWIYSYELLEDETYSAEEVFGTFNEIRGDATVSKTSFTIIGNNYTVDGGGCGSIVLEPYKFDTESELKTQTLNVTSVTWTNFASVTGGVIYNDSGTVNLTSVTFMSNIATGTDTVAGKGGAIANYNGGTVNINGATFAENNATYGKDIYNSGTVNFNGGQNVINGGIMGAGTTSINGATVTFGAYANLQQYGLTIDENSELQINASNLVIGTGYWTDSEEYIGQDNVTYVAITADGNLILTGGINENIINGTGILTVTGDLINNNTITQSTVTIEAGVTTNSSSITTTGTGIVIAEGAGLTTNASDIDTYTNNGEVANGGILTYTGGTNGNIISGTGILTVTGDLINNNTITQSTVTIEAGVTTNNAGVTITANSLLEVSSDTAFENDGVVNSGEFRNYGNVLNYNEIDTIETGFTNYATGVVINTGTIKVTNNLGNFGSIESSGTIDALVITNASEIKNYENALIKATVLNNFEQISGTTVAGMIENFTGGTITADNLYNGIGTIINNGTMTVTNALTSSGTITNSGEITANAIDNYEGAAIINIAGGSITANEITNGAGASIENEEYIKIVNNLVNAGMISSTGTIEANAINNRGNITNYEGGVITTTAGITNSGIVTAYNANGMQTTIDNKDGGVYNVYGGTIAYNVSGESADKATVNILGDVTISSNAIITQNKVYLGDGEEEVTLKLQDETNLRASQLVISSNSTLDTRNEKVNEINTDGSITILSGLWNYAFDVDLKQGIADKLLNVTADANSVANIEGVNILSDKAQKSYILISTGAAGNIHVTNLPLIYTSNIRYSIKDSTMSNENSTWLEIEASGYGGLPNAVYDSASIYSVTGLEGDEEHDYVTEWITDENGQHDTLKTDLKINGNGRILLSSTSVTGIRTGAYSLKVSSLTGFNGFTNAITVEQVSTTTAEGIETEYGKLAVTDVTFSNNIGDGVIISSGIVTLNNVTFDSNTVTTAVIVNDYSLTLSSVTFKNNNTEIDVANNGDLLITGTGPTTFEKGISGAGTTTIKGVAVDMSSETAKLQQNRVEISYAEGSSLTTNIANTEVNLFMNDGQLILIGGDNDTLTSEINGIGDTEISSGTVTVANRIAQTKITLTGTNAIIDDNNGFVKATTVTVVAGSTLTANADNIDTFATNGKIENEGKLMFTGGTNNNTITGIGNMSISGDVVNAEGTKIEQSTITIGGKFTTNASDVLANINNGNKLIFTGGVNNSTVTYYAGGSLTVNGDLTNNAEITSYITIASGTTTNNGKMTSGGSLQILEGAGLITDAGNISADAHSDGVVNDGSLTFTGGTNNNVIDGSGSLFVTDSLLNYKGIKQNSITITNGYFLNYASDDIVTANLTVGENAVLYEYGDNGGKVVADNVLNKGIVNIINSTVENTSIYTGMGELKLTGTNFENRAEIIQSTVTIDKDSIFTSDVNSITAYEKIQSAGALMLQGDGINKNTIEGYDGTEGYLVVNGNIINSTGTTISQSSITVASGSFETSANDITTNGIENNAELTLTGGTLKDTNAITGSGNLTVTDNLTNLAAIRQDGEVSITNGLLDNQSSITAGSVSVAEGAGLKTNANNLETTDGVFSDGEIIFTGGENWNEIEGTGDLFVEGSMGNHKDITQNKIVILSGLTFSNYTGILRSTNVIVGENALLTTYTGIEAGTVTNDGFVSMHGDSTTALTVDNNSVYVGTGELKISSTVFTNNSSITQSTVTVDKDSIFTSDVNNIKVLEEVNNAGIFNYIGTGVNGNAINGTGGLVISGDIINSTGTVISQSSITVASGSFETSANDIITTAGIVNEAELTLTGGTLIASNAISGAGNLTVTDTLDNSATIDQTSIAIQKGIFTNARGSSIIATNVAAGDDTTVVTDAADFNADNMSLGTNSLLNLLDDADAELGANITGDGKLIKQGSGVVTLSGTNSYSGTTTITDGAIRILSADNISTNTIYADGGKLIVNTDSGTVTLGNEITGTDHNDVEIEVTGSTDTASTILTGAILGNENLVKTGEGILDLQMETNSYVGDTIISSGTLRGTTKNINGIVAGSGADSSVEFYDEEGEVTLNEIADMGTFGKTGAAVMTVTESFKAIDANIESGTFIINNDASMGGSGKDFTVENTMKVTNALLKGYSNITAADLIISTGATFAPGNSTATAKVSGNLKFEGDGTYDVEMGQTAMDTAGHYNDTTEVGGTTTIGEDSKLILNNVKGKYYLPEEIAIIEGGVSEANYKDGNITFNDSDAEGLREGFDTRISTTVYAEGNNLMVKLERKASDYANASEFDKNHNEEEAAKSIDAISQGNGGDITAALDTLEKFYYYETTYSTSSLKAALNDVAGVIHANATNLTRFNTKAEHVYDKIKERTLDLFPCTKFHDKIWAEYYYNNYNVDKDDNSPKYDTNVNGFLVGFDAISAKGWTLGIMAGYGTSELKQESDKATMNDINAGLYGGYEGKKWSFKSMLLGGYESYDITRQIAFMGRRATSEHKGYSGALDAEIGYKISLNKAGSNAKHKMYLRPFIGAIGSYINNEGYKEKGAEDLNLKIEGYDAFSAEARAGLGINGKVKKFGWYAKVGARQLLTDKYNEIETSLLNFSDSTKMKIRSAENSQTTLTGGIGADYQLSDAWTIFANGLGNFADKSTNYYANVGLAYKFGCINNKPKADTSDKDVERLSDLLESQLDKDSYLKKKLKAKQKKIDAIDAKKKQIEAREKQLLNRIQKYEANIVSETKAEKLKEKTLKQIKLKNKPTFVFGTAKLTKKGKAALAQVAEELKQYPEDSELLIEGYTDSVGPDDVNQKLSEDRAVTIAKTLKNDYNIKNNINVIGKGEKNPVASNSTKAGRAKNRRVEIIITAPVDDEGPEDDESTIEK